MARNGLFSFSPPNITARSLGANRAPYSPSSGGSQHIALLSSGCANSPCAIEALGELCMQILCAYICIHPNAVGEAGVWSLFSGAQPPPVATQRALHCHSPYIYTLQRISLPSLLEGSTAGAVQHFGKHGGQIQRHSHSAVLRTVQPMLRIYTFSGSLEACSLSSSLQSLIFFSRALEQCWSGRAQSAVLGTCGLSRAHAATSLFLPGLEGN